MFRKDVWSKILILLLQMTGLTQMQTQAKGLKIIWRWWFWRKISCGFWENRAHICSVGEPAVCVVQIQSKIALTKNNYKIPCSSKIILDVLEKPKFLLKILLL